VKRPQQIAALVALSLALVTVSLQAQQSTEGSGNEPAEDSSLAVPVTMNGQTGTQAFVSETILDRYLSGGVSVVGIYSDNALLSNSGQISNFSYMAQPHLTWSESTPRLKWNLGMSAGFLESNHLPNENQGAEGVNLNATWRLTEHASVRLADTFSNTTGLFASIPSAEPESGIGVVQQSNHSLIVPPGQRVLSNQSLAELTDQAGLNTVIGVRGTYGLLDYPESSQSTQFGTLYDTRTYSAEAFYNWKFSAKQWLGVTARGQRFETLPSLFTTDVGGLLLYYSYTAGPRLTVTLFGGPEYAGTSQTASAPAAQSGAHGSLWGSSEGATLDWAGARTSASLTFSRQLNDGGGLAAPVNLQTVSATLRRSLSAYRNEIQLGVSDSTNSPLPQASLPAASFRGLSTSVALQQRLAGGFIVRTGYTWLRQDVPTTGSSSSANNVWFSLAWDFMHPLGR